MVVTPVILYTVESMKNNSVCTAAWGKSERLCWGGGGELSMLPECDGDILYFIQDSGIQKPCRMNPHLRIYLIEFFKCQ